MIGVRPHVTCAGCGQIHVLERTFVQAATFRMLCHGCEAPLKVTVPWRALQLRHSVAAVSGALCSGKG